MKFDVKKNLQNIIAVVMVNSVVLAVAFAGSKKEKMRSNKRNRFTSTS